jgi:hypothetical protein
LASGLRRAHQKRRSSNRLPRRTSLYSVLSPPNKLERVKGIEPSQPAWKAGALPLSYTRRFTLLLKTLYQAIDAKGIFWLAWRMVEGAGFEPA